MKMFADHDDYANMPQEVKRVKVSRSAGGGDSSYYIPDDTMSEADSIVKESVSKLKKFSTKQK
jgi:hypothetical protein